MILGAEGRRIPHRRCPACGCNVAQLPHAEGSTQCDAAYEARVHTYAGDNN